MAAAFLSKLSLARRIHLGLALLLALFALVTTVAIVGFVQTSRRMAALEGINRQVLLQDEASYEVSAIAEETQRFASEGRPSSVDRVALHHERLTRYLAEIRATTPSPAMTRVYLEMEEHVASFDRTFQASIQERLLRTTLVKQALPQAQALLDETFEELSRDPTIAVEDVLACRLQFLEAQADANQYFQELDSRHVDSAKAHLVMLRRQLEALARKEGAAASALDQAVSATDAYQAAMLQVVQATRGYLYLTDVVMAGEIAEFLHKSDRLRSAAADAAIRGYQEARASMTLTMIALIGTFLFVVLFAPLLSGWLSKSILEPISQITDTFRSLSDNEVMSSIPGGDSSDEMGALARAAEKFRQKNQEARELVLKTEAAEAANRAKSAFLANMSHELRTPLHAVLGFSTLLRSDPSMSPEQHASLDIINTSGEHLLGLINDVLDMAKIESGRTVLEITSFDPRTTIRDIDALMRQRAESKGLQMVPEVAADVPAEVRGDETKLRQVIINLVGNAVKFTSGGTVTLRLASGSVGESHRPGLVIEVEDTGRGIAPEDRRRIFEPFVQLSQSDQTGTGLGLTITRQFVELMGGAIELESTRGHGSKFRVEIPMEILSAPAGARVVEAEGTGAPDRGELLEPDAMAMLSQELRGELVDALVSLDRVRIAGAIQSVSAVAPDLGGTLARHADRMEYSFILRAVQAVTGSGTQEAT